MAKGDFNDPGDVRGQDRMYRKGFVMREEEPAHFGQKIRTETSPDKSSDRIADQKEALMGRPMRGGPLDISHSIGGEPDEVETYNETGRTARPWKSQGLNRPEDGRQIKNTTKRRG